MNLAIASPEAEAILSRVVATEPAEPPAVTGNHAAISMALTNLLDNALTYAPPASTVEVELEGPATIRVRDRGPGVAEAERSTIFARFHRSPGAHPGGSGLGLAIVAEIAMAHGGRVWVEPRDQGGAEFILQLGPAA